MQVQIVYILRLLIRVCFVLKRSSKHDSCCKWVGWSLAMTIWNIQTHGGLKMVLKKVRRANFYSHSKNFIGNNLSNSFKNISSLEYSYWLVYYIRNYKINYIFNFSIKFRFKERVKDRLEDLETEVGKEYDKVSWLFFCFYYKNLKYFVVLWKFYI
jgi:hypothetical protein